MALIPEDVKFIGFGHVTCAFCGKKGRATGYNNGLVAIYAICTCDKPNYSITFERDNEVSTTPTHSVENNNN
jgi:hypothetical protein